MSRRRSALSLSLRGLMILALVISSLPAAPVMPAHASHTGGDQFADACEPHAFGCMPPGWTIGASLAWYSPPEDHRAGYVTDGDDGTDYWANASAGCSGTCAYFIEFVTTDWASALKIGAIRVKSQFHATLTVTCHDGDPAHTYICATIEPGTTDTGYVDLAPGICDTHCQAIRIENSGSLPSGFKVETVSAFAPDFGEAHTGTFGAHADGAYSADPVNLGTGVFTTQATDLSFPGRVLPFAFTRWYNSADKRAGVLGPGWTHTYDLGLTDSGSTVEVRRGDGRRDVFSRNLDLSYAVPPDVFDSLTKNPDATFTLVSPAQVSYEFTAAGRLSRIREPAGNEVTFAYTAGELTGITDPAGRQVGLSYSGGRLSEIEGPLGRKVTYSYDAQGRLATVTDRIGNTPGEDPAQHRWQYGYDGVSGHLVTIIDPDGRVRVTNVYDGQGRVAEQRDGLNKLTTIAYGTLTTTVTDPRGHPSTYTFDSRMRVLSQTDVVGPDTYTVSYTYDAVGNRTGVIDREGNTTNLTYDARGNVLAKTDPSPDGVAPRPVTTFEYDSKNNLTKITDAAGAVTTLTYDQSTNALLSVTRQVDATTTATTSYEYADLANPGLPTRIYSPRGNATGTPDPTYSTALAYDAFGNLVMRRDADGAVTTFGYDGAGRLTSFIDPDGNAPGGVPSLHVWTIGYDALDRETARTDPLGNTLRYAYDGAGNRTSLTDRSGDLTTYAYDANTRLAAVGQKPDPAGPVSYVTAIERDGNGNATRITQGNGAITDYAFDPLDRLTGVTTYPAPTGPLTTTYVLGGNGQPTSRTTGDGVTVTYSYDALARLTGVSGPSLSVAYGYDAVGRRTQMTDVTGTTSYAYDALGRVTQIAAPGGTLAYQYDLDGDRTQLTYPGGDPVTYGYSPGGRLETVTDWAGRTSTYSYTPSSLVDTLSQHGDLTATYTYDRAQRLTGSQYTRSVGGLPVGVASQAFTLDPEGNRTQLVESALLGGASGSDTFTYGYDGLSRLLSADAVLFGGGTRSETFSYDAATNIQARTGPAATYTMDGANRVTADGTQGFTWDGADRLIQRGADAFTYDALSRLTSATVVGTTTTYSYDGDGLLAGRTGSAGSTSFIWDSSVAPAPLLEAGTDRVVHGLGPLYLARADGSTIRLVRDALGGVRAEVSDLGLVTKAFRYAAYGAISDRFPSDATPTLIGFTGELADPSGLTYLRARWYDPGTGRFVSSDEYPGSPAHPVSLNAFGYAYGNPAAMVDPSGHCPPCIVGAVLVGLKVGLFVSDVVGTLETLADANASKGEKAFVTGLLVLGTFSSGGQATVARGAIQAARAVAQASRSRGVLVMPGGIRAAEQLFADATQGARIRPHPRVPGGQLADLAEGGHLGLRPISRSGEATLDVNIPGVDVRKIKFLPE